jgi:hypothetical protein
MAQMQPGDPIPDAIYSPGAEVRVSQWVVIFTGRREIQKRPG